MFTYSRIGIGNQLGAQMSDFAYLYYISRENDQKLVWWEDLMNFRRGYQFLKVFSFPNESILRSKKWLKLFSRWYCGLFCHQHDNWKWNYRRIYENKFLWTMDRVFLRIIEFTHRDFKLIEAENINEGGGRS